MKVLGSYEKARLYIERHTAKAEEALLLKRKLNPGPTITISRETGIGAELISEQLIKYLADYSIDDYKVWAFFDKNIIEKVIQDHGLPEHFKKFMNEETPKKLDSWLMEILGVASSKLTLVKKISETILTLAEYGNVIIIGRGANIVTSKLNNTFHIRLVAPLNFRINRAMEIYKLTKKDATDFIKKEDESRREFMHTYFHKNIEDPLLYHVVINTDLLGIEEISEMIGSCIRKQFPKFFRQS